MTYSKKQMQPLIDKYCINPEVNKLFIKTCEVFDGKPNYQVWAVKMIFSQQLKFDELEHISEWVNKNSNLISKLEKKNIISYSNKAGIAQLLQEIEGIEYISLIKNIISHFNTKQKKILTEALLSKEYTPLEAYNDDKIKGWYDVFKLFNKKPMNIKNKFYSTCSALQTAEELMQAILDCLKDSYVWKEGKEDLLTFIEHNASDCEIVFNEGACVIVRVPSFESGHKLCGSGRTGWCICREEEYFKRYVTDYKKRSQYFLFDFNRKETDAFAHIGFTTQGGYGVVEAQTCHNFPMMTPFTQDDEKLSIYDVLKNVGAKLSLFMPLPNDLKEKWNVISIKEMFRDKPESFALSYEKDGRIVVNVMNNSSFYDIIDYTFINKDRFRTIDSYTKMYLLFDCNLPLGDENSLIAIQVSKDRYGCESISKIMRIDGTDITQSNYLSEIGISNEDFVNREKLDPSIMLHKLIHEGNEIEAIKLIEEEKGNINVNYEFEESIPVFSAINGRMPNLFNAIINCEGFESKLEDGFGETLIESLLFLYGSKDVETSKDDKTFLEGLIKSVLSCKNYDLNHKDINNDTAINSACMYPNELWVVKELVSRKDIDINIINDFNYAPIDTCIHFGNIDALKLLCQRKDLVISKNTKALAKKHQINLDEYIKSKKRKSSVKTEDAFEYILTRAQ